MAIFTRDNNFILRNIAITKKCYVVSYKNNSTTTTP